MNPQLNMGITGHKPHALTAAPCQQSSLDYIYVPSADVDGEARRYAETMETGQRYAVYQLVRPEAVHLFDGRIDT